jgi:3'-phosphoadenosine 5'-phosphosulfate sulfotransferase (PAPS reductase)/FAD synthetase
LSEQLSILPSVDADELVARAKAEHRPIATVCLFSGGNDSAVLAHRCREHYDQLVFIDTGTAVPGVREFVESFAQWIDKPLWVYESGDAYRRMVLNPEFGFPGPAQHGRAYTRLKERQTEVLLRDLKTGHPRSARALALTGLRRAESTRRKKRQPITRRGGLVFANPLIDWTNQDVRDHRTEHKLPESDVAALIHRSGECNCGAYAQPGEREMLRSLWPDWFETTIAGLEREAEAAGISACRWGERPGIGEAGPMCSSCDWRQMDLLA